MKLNLKQKALQFVIDNNCACHTPVELIHKAMEIGADEAVKFAHDQVLKATLNLKEKRAKNLRG